VEGYTSEQEQVESLKRWWKANGPSIVVGIALSAALVIGGKWWLARQQDQAELVSGQSEQVLQEAQKGNGAAALERGGRLLQSSASSSYAAMTALVLAKLKVDQGDLEGTRYYLQWVLDHASDESLKDVARLRLAQALLAKGDMVGALQTVGAVNAKFFPVAAQELKGDILLAMGKRDEARAAYGAAIAANTGGADQTHLQMKLTEVGGKGAP